MSKTVPDAIVEPLVHRQAPWPARAMASRSGWAQFDEVRLAECPG